MTFRHVLRPASRACAQRKASDEILARAALGYRAPRERVTAAPRRCPIEEARR